MVDPRSYADPCGISRALDRIGERWALLVVRELVLGPKRFTDLRAGLPTASPNVLSQRLRELEGHGVVARRALQRPAGATVYELTPWGRELEPVILALGRWGARAAPVRGELGVDSTLLALASTFDAQAAAGLRARIGVDLGDGHGFTLQISRKRLEISRGLDAACDATLTTDPATLRQITLGGHDITRLKRGAATTTGDAALLKRVLGLFPRPPQAG